jgi:NAD(P)H-quinone oxidoreductase subunit 5
MLSPDQWMALLGYIVVAVPLLLAILLGVSTLVGWNLPERTISNTVCAGIVTGLLAAVAVLVLMLSIGSRHVALELGDWVLIPDYRFSVKFVFDRLSVPFAILSFVLTGTVGAFASSYLHRDDGFNRFFTLYTLFVLGMVVSALAGNIETLFAGWELVGLSAALLVSFFQERPAPARNALFVWVVYRVADAAFLLAAVVMMHLNGRGDFDVLLGTRGGLSWPEGHVAVPPYQALIVGLLLLVAAAGKSALVPFSGWLPRAMEGPTPSSAIFYGALSVHLGAFLLLRVSPLLEASVWLTAAVVVLGLVTALHAWLAGNVQTDIKNALSFASLLQVGLIVAEIGICSAVVLVGQTLSPEIGETVIRVGIGLRYLVLVHLLGHACLRTLQFLRAPTLLHDYHLLENAIGTHLPRAGTPWLARATQGLRRWLYRFGLERGYLDTLLVDRLAASFVWLFRRCDALERRWTDLLAGQASRDADELQTWSGRMEELP